LLWFRRIKNEPLTGSAICLQKQFTFTSVPEVCGVDDAHKNLFNMKHLRIVLPFFFVHCLLSCKTQTTSSLETTEQQLSAINELLRSDSFSLHIARAQDTAYYKGIGEPVPPFLTPEQDTAIFVQPVVEQKVATNIAGFYALECGIGLLCQQTKETPTHWLQKIVTEQADSSSILLLNRFANATWKAGQPFRGLDRITRPTFTVASFLPPNEIAKDYYQIKTAAAKLLSTLQPVKDSSLNTQMQQLRSLLHSQQYAYEMAAFMDSGYYAGQQQKIPAFRTAMEDSGFVRRSARDQKIATNLAGFYAMECALNYLVSTKLR